jgi:hypothetical protein
MKGREGSEGTWRFSVGYLPSYISRQKFENKRVISDLGMGGNPTFGSTFRIAKSSRHSLTFGKTLFCVESDGWEKLARIIA